MNNMSIRLIKSEDFDKVRDIHRRFYEKEFAFPFDRPGVFSNKYVITDEHDNPITFGMLELSAEAIVLTDKSYPVFDRVEALTKLFQCLEFDARKNGLFSFHATVIDNPSWESWLKKYGFENCKGNFLFHKISD